MAEDEEEEEEEEGKDGLVAIWEEEENYRDGSSLYPMYFGISSSFLSLHLLSAATDQNLAGHRRRHLAEMLLHGSASLLGLLFWRTQKAAEKMAASLRRAESEVAHLKILRMEDAKANEKVMGILAEREQRWISDKRKLKLQIKALMNQFRVLEMDKSSRMAAMEEKIRKMEEEREIDMAGMEEREKMMSRVEEEREKTLREIGEEREKMIRELGEMEEKVAAMEVEREEMMREMEEREKKIAEVEERERKMMKEREMMMREMEEGEKMWAEMKEREMKMEEEIKKMMAEIEEREKKIEEEKKKMMADIGMERETLMAEIAKERDMKMEEERQKMMGEIEEREMKMAEMKRNSKQKESLKMKRRVSMERRSGLHDRTLLIDYLRAESRMDEYNKEQDCSPRRAKIEAFEDLLQKKDKKLEACQRRLFKKELELKSLNMGFSHFREESFKLEAQLNAMKSQLASLRLRANCPEHRNSYFSTSLTTRIIEDGDFDRVDHSHSIRVDCKIKRLKQQLLTLERVDSSMGFLPALTLLRKQLKRYQILQEKVNDLCQRMANSDLPLPRSKCEDMEGFLEEAFLFQRNIGAAGQKVAEIQSWVSTNLAAAAEGQQSATTEFSLARFAAVVRILFREVQAGMEGRIAQIIEKLEETLAHRTILHERG